MMKEEVTHCEKFTITFNFTIDKKKACYNVLVNLKIISA